MPTRCVFIPARRQRTAKLLWRALVPRRRARRFANLGEADVEDAIRLPIFVVVMPPLRLVDGEAYGLHRRAQQVTQASRFTRAALIVDVRALAHLVVLGRHLNDLA